MNNKSLHVGYITSEYIIPPHKLDGGLATYVQKVSRSLVGRGMHASVFCLSDRDHSWVDEGVQVYEVQVDPHRLIRGIKKLVQPTTEMEQLLSDSSTLAKKVWEVHARDPLDVIQAASYQAVGLALCGNGKIPLITRISSLASLYRNADAVSTHPNTLSTALTDWCEIHQIEHSESSFAPSALMAAQASLLAQATPQVIRTPIDLFNQDLDETFFTQNLRGLKYLLFFGTLNRMKGVEVISRAIGELVAEFPDLHFVFIGRTHRAANHRTHAENLLQENQGWKDNVHYFPSLPKQALYPVIRNSTAVLIPSLIDNYPNTCLEAMQFGRLVIATRGTSLDEMILDGETGILVERNDVNSLQEGIRRLMLLPAAQKMDMETRAARALQAVISEDRIGQLIQLYAETVRNYKPAAIDQSVSWDAALLARKLRIGFLPGVLIKVREKAQQIKN